MEKTLSGAIFNEFECNYFIHQVYEGIVRQFFVCLSLHQSCYLAIKKNQILKTWKNVSLYISLFESSCLT